MLCFITIGDDARASLGAGFARRGLYFYSDEKSQNKEQ